MVVYGNLILNESSVAKRCAWIDRVSVAFLEQARSISWAEFSHFLIHKPDRVCHTRGLLSFNSEEIRGPVATLEYECL